MDHYYSKPEHWYRSRAPHWWRLTTAFGGDGPPSILLSYYRWDGSGEGPFKGTGVPNWTLKAASEDLALQIAREYFEAGKGLDQHPQAQQWHDSKCNWDHELETVWSA